MTTQLSAIVAEMRDEASYWNDNAREHFMDGNDSSGFRCQDRARPLTRYADRIEAALVENPAPVADKGSEQAVAWQRRHPIVKTVLPALAHEPLNADDIAAGWKETPLYLRPAPLSEAGGVSEEMVEEACRFGAQSLTSADATGLTEEQIQRRIIEVLIAAGFLSRDKYEEARALVESLP